MTESAESKSGAAPGLPKPRFGVPRLRVTRPISEIKMKPRKALTTDMFGP